MKRYLWIVWKNNRFAGYVEAIAEGEALQKAQDKFGKEYIWVERTSCCHA